MRNAPGTTPHGRAALDWLEKHGGDGVFADQSHQVLLAQGEHAPFMRSTWNELKRLGYIEYYGNRRARLVPGYQAEPLQIAQARLTRPVSLG